VKLFYCQNDFEAIKCVTITALICVIKLDDLMASRFKARALSAHNLDRGFESCLRLGCLCFVSLCCVVLCR
jgi:hypothetical protein